MENFFFFFKENMENVYPPGSKLGPLKPQVPTSDIKTALFPLLTCTVRSCLLSRPGKSHNFTVHLAHAGVSPGPEMLGDLLKVTQLIEGKAGTGTHGSYLLIPVSSAAALPTAQ